MEYLDAPRMVKVLSHSPFSQAGHRAADVLPAGDFQGRGAAETGGLKRADDGGQVNHAVAQGDSGHAAAVERAALGLPLRAPSCNQPR